MKHIFKLIVAILLIPALVFAQDNISLDPGPIGNGRLLGAKTYDGQATVGVLGVDSSGNTTVQSLSGKVVNFPGNVTVTGTFGTTGVTSLANGTAAAPSLTFTSDPDTGIYRSAADVIGFATGGAVRLLMTSGNLKFPAATNGIVGSDSGTAGQLTIAGATHASTSVGAYLQVNGNTNAGLGAATLYAGNVAGSNLGIGGWHSTSTIDFIAGGTSKWTMGAAGTLIGTGTSDVGWAIVAAANQACNTTCVTPCVFGQETTSKAILACTDATADSCLCAGAT